MSNTSNDGPGNNAPSRALGQIRLVQNRSGIWVEAPDGKAFEPFHLPKLTFSMMDWTAAFCERVWQKHTRCVGIVLLLNTRTHAWGLGFPHQRCMEDAACWSSERSDFPGADQDVRIGGSFQTRSLFGDDNFRGTVPLINGVHLVMLAGVHQRVIWTYLRTGDDIWEIKPSESLWYDDILAVVSEYQDRFEMV